MKRLIPSRKCGAKSSIAKERNREEAQKEKSPSPNVTLRARGETLVAEDMHKRTKGAQCWADYAGTKGAAREEERETR